MLYEDDSNPSPAQRLSDIKSDTAGRWDEMARRSIEACRARLCAVCALASDAWAAHAYAQFGDIKYPAGFSHFEWANPGAPSA